MFCQALLILSAFCQPAVPGAAEPSELGDGSKDGIKQGGIERGRSQTGGQSYGDQNRGGSRGFYSYPRHRHIDGARSDRSRPTYSNEVASHSYDGNHGSPYYGRNYGAPYHGGGYYEGGIYYRERRD